jgi:hypothetical protein
MLLFHLRKSLHFTPAVLSSQRRIQPCAAKGPQSIGRSTRNTQGLARLLVGQPGVEAEFDQLGCLGIHLLEPLQGVVQREQLFRRHHGGHIRLVQSHPFEPAAVLDSLLPTRLLDQDPSHCFGSGGEEVASIVPVRFVSAALGDDQPQPCLVNQCGGLKGLARSFPGELRGGKPAQFVVEQGQQFIARMAFAILNPLQDLRHLAHDVQSPGTLWLMGRAVARDANPPLPEDKRNRWRSLNSG